MTTTSFNTNAISDWQSLLPPLREIGNELAEHQSRRIGSEFRSNFVRKKDTMLIWRSTLVSSLKKLDRSILEGESIILFRAAIRSKFTLDPYERRLANFLMHINMTCDEFVKKAKENSRNILGKRLNNMIREYVATDPRYQKRLDAFQSAQ